MPLPVEYTTILRVRIVGTLHGSQTNNVLHFASQGPDFQPDALIALAIQLGTAVLACVVETLLPAVTSDWNCTSVETQVIHPNLTDAQIVSPQVSGQGQRGPTSVSFAAQLMNLRSGIDGRRGRGKLFLPPPGESDIEASITAAPTMDLYAAFLACIAGKFIGAAATEDFRLVVYSRKDDDGIGQTPLSSSRLVQSLQAKSTVARCGSRKLGVGA
jgi:hypothetical protein